MSTLNLLIEEVLSTDLWDSLSDRGLESVDLVVICDEDGKEVKTLTVDDYEYFQGHLECTMEAIIEYWQEVCDRADIDYITERLLFPNTEEDWRDYIGEVLQVPDRLYGYMDWDHIIRDAKMDHTYTTNWVFSG